jgi:hypothetical protein
VLSLMPDIAVPVHKHSPYALRAKIDCKYKRIEVLHNRSLLNMYSKFNPKAVTTSRCQQSVMCLSGNAYWFVFKKIVIVTQRVHFLIFKTFLSLFNIFAHVLYDLEHILCYCMVVRTLRNYDVSHQASFTSSSIVRPNHIQCL